MIILNFMKIDASHLLAYDNLNIIKTYTYIGIMGYIWELNFEKLAYN